MDVAKLEKEWGQEYKDVKGAVPTDKDLLAEISSVQGALTRLKNVKATADKASEEWEKIKKSADKASEDLRKAVAQVLTSVDLTEKEVAGYEAVIKKLKRPTSLGPDTSKDLKKLTDEMKALKSSL